MTQNADYADSIGIDLGELDDDGVVGKGDASCFMW